MKEQILALVTLFSTTILPASESATTLLSPLPDYLQYQEKQILAEESLDLTSREPNPDANQGYTDNILLALHYLNGEVMLPVDWEEVRKPFEVSFVLQPGEIFAFHENVLPEFAHPAVTMNSEFLTTEGYKSVWGLGGNGVCHLASLMNWVANEAGLEVISKANHSFALIPGISQEYGTSIRSQSSSQNLYIINSLDQPVSFWFKTDSQWLTLEISQLK
ncbi:MAG: VanW family protein [Candidatus Marinimicrobia bacterium]|nr:VanW family protein [Candidatus Neomarinimicrobiota bacterium]